MKRMGVRAVLICGLAAVGAGCDRANPPLPVIGDVPDFSLITQDGVAVSAKDFRGKVWVADFIFTHCAGPCPIMSRAMSQLQDRLEGQRDVALVSFSVDPVRDTPAVLREYAARYNARPERWTFITGDKEQIFRLAVDGFKLTVVDETDVDPILHSTHFMVVDRAGRIRGAFDGTEPGGVDRVVQAVEGLLVEEAK